MSKSYTTGIFIEKANNVHSNKYDYTLTEYIKSDIKVKIICPDHGIFEQRATSHLKYGCNQCANKQNAINKIQTLNTFISKALKIHGLKYDYSLCEYIHNAVKIKIICSIHGVFEQTPHDHISGKNGCPKCRCSKMENVIKIWLKSNNICFEEQKRFQTCRNKNPLPFDFYLPNHNICIEFDGRHHFEIVNRSKNKNKNAECFIQTCINDNIKNKFCYNNGIQLVRIPFYDINNIDKYLVIIDNKLSI